LRGCLESLALKFKREYYPRFTILTENPEVGKPLHGSYFADTTLRIKVRSFRVGEYRVIYWYDKFKDTVWLLVVGHRKWVYKLLKRL